MKLLLDFFPILLFFGAFKLADIYVATGVLMAATVLQMAVIWLSQRRLEPMQKATLVLILLFGALTLLLHDERFIKWKPTVLYGAMAIALAVALWGFRKNFLQDAAGRAARAARPRSGRRLNVALDRLLPLHGGASTATWRPTSAPRPGSTSSSGAMCSRSCSWSRRASTSRRT